MNLTTECCAKCGIELFESVAGSSGRKIFRSFGTRTINGVEIHFCMNCYKGLNDISDKENANDEQREICTGIR